MFEIGDVWKNGKGEKIKILTIRSGIIKYPILGENIENNTKKWYSSIGRSFFYSKSLTDLKEKLEPGEYPEYFI